MLRLLVALAAGVEVLVALYLLPSRDISEFPLLSPPFALGIQICAFSLIGGGLLVTARDERSRILGITYLIIASTFSYPIVAKIPETTAFARFPLDALLPYFLWTFVASFPGRVLIDSTDKIIQVARWFSLFVGTILLIANIVPELTEFLSRLDRQDPRSMYASLVYIPVGLALPVLFYRSRFVSAEERRRVHLFAVGLFVPGLVLCLLPVLTLVPEIDQFFIADGRYFVIPIVHLVALSIPLVTAYAVVVDQVVPVRFLLNRVLRYWLGRVLASLLIAAPFFLAAYFLWLYRTLAIDELFGGLRGASLFALVVVCAAAIRYRLIVSRAIDHTFFREPYDAGKLLAELGDGVSTANDLRTISAVLRGTLGDRMHIEGIHLLVCDTDNVWQDPEQVLRSLEPESPLVSALARGSVPLPTNEHVGELARHWIIDSNLELLTAVNDSRGKPIAAIALGVKRSGLRFSEQDQELVNTAAGVVSPHIARVTSTSTPVSSTNDWQVSSLCPQCNRVLPGDTAQCPECGIETQVVGLPAIIAGKYQLERRLGSGATGVVYEATDTSLDRQVALKTLPHLSAEKIESLRSEARAMASISHPNLTTIYGLESWRGAPILVVELLVGGTLHQRLQNQRLGYAEAIELGIVVLDACDCLHRNGIIHRDIKPSNIGYSADGTPKLLDFGLAQVKGIEDPAQSYIAGTPLYLPPEVFEGNVTDVMLDLWAFSMTLYEALAGEHPIPRGSLASVVHALRHQDIPLMSTQREDCPPAIDRFFEISFTREPRRRLVSANIARATLVAAREEPLQAA